MPLVYPQGNVADGQPDFGRSIKIGSIARSALPGAEIDGDRVPIMVDLFGRVIVATLGGTGFEVEGTIKHDDPITAAQKPVVVGGVASASPPTAVSADSDVVRWSTTRFGQQRIAISGVDQGNVPRDIIVATSAAGITAANNLLGVRAITAGDVAHDGVDANAPVKIGARALTNFEPGADVSSGDRTDLIASLQGDNWVVSRALMAGERLGGQLDYLAVHFGVHTDDIDIPRYASAGNTLESTRVLMNRPGNVYEMTALNASGAPLYFMFFDRVTAPASGATVPIYVSIPIAAGGYATYDFNERPFHFTTGSAMALSTTPAIYTAPGAAAGYMSGRYF